MVSGRDQREYLPIGPIRFFSTSRWGLVVSCSFSFVAGYRRQNKSWMPSRLSLSFHQPTSPQHRGWYHSKRWANTATALVLHQTFIHLTPHSISPALRIKTISKRMPHPTENETAKATIDDRHPDVIPILGMRAGRRQAPTASSTDKTNTND